jgi:hypothetical protein
VFAVSISAGSYCNVRFEVFTAVTMKNGVFCMFCSVALVRTETSVLTRATRRNIPEDTISQLLQVLQ